MLAIKLKQIGKKKQHTFRVIVAEKRSKMGGTNTEDLGSWNPHTNKFTLNKERVLYWIKNGAQPTATVHNILITGKIIEGTKIPMHKTPAKTAETPKPETAPEAAATA